jgi:hypothetical protein
MADHHLSIEQEQFAVPRVIFASFLRATKDAKRKILTFLKIYFANIPLKSLILVIDSKPREIMSSRIREKFLFRSFPVV